LEVPWRDHSSFVTTYYAILTAMVGAILALAITVGAAFFCIGIVASAGVLEYAAVAAAIAYWGGTGVAAWSLGHAIFC